MDYIAIGTIYGSHGVHGYLKVGSFSGELDHFRLLEWIQLRRGTQTRQFEVEDVRLTARHALLKLAGVDTPEGAADLSRWEVWVPRRYACPLGEQEYYSADLHGLQLVCEGEEVGTVISVWHNGPADLLEIERPDGRRQVVPFVEHFIGEVDLRRRCIELKRRWVLE